MNLTGNTILITGGGSGIGLALAGEFLLRNNCVIICGRTLDRLKNVQKMFPSVEIIQCDISDEDSVALLVEEIQQKYSNLNFLINNAGVMRMWNIQRKTTSIKEQRTEILTNFFGTVQVTQSLIPHLLKQQSSMVLNISSALAYVPMSAAPIYSATKAALHSYSIAIRQQLQNTSVKVAELLPAAIETDMAAEIEKSIGIEASSPKMTPEKLAMLTLKGLKKDSREIRPGMANLLHLIYRMFPSLAEKIIEGQSKKILVKL